MLHSYLTKDSNSIKHSFLTMLEHLGVFLFILFIPLTALFVMGVAFIAGIFTKGLVR